MTTAPPPKASHVYGLRVARKNAPAATLHRIAVSEADATRKARLLPSVLGIVHCRQLAESEARGVLGLVR